MLDSLSRLLIATLRLVSTFCRLLTTFGCYHSNNHSATSVDHNSSNGVLNRHCNGTIANGKSMSPHNGTTNGSIGVNHSSNHKTITNGYGYASYTNGNYVTNGHNGYSATIPNGYRSHHNHNHNHYQHHPHHENGNKNISFRSSTYRNGNTLITATRSAPITVRPVVPTHMIVSNYICHGTLFLFGYFNDFLRRIGALASFEKVERHRDGYGALYSSFATFYIRNIIQRLINMWCHPIDSLPGATINILERKFGPYNGSWVYTGRNIKAINMGSYNYLGYAENEGDRIEAVQDDISKLGVGLGTSPNELGTYRNFARLQAQVAQFLGVEDSVVIGMGFATNALCLPCLFGPGCLVISDQNNHSSLALGCKLSGATVRVFKHNDMKDLERLLREGISRGQPPKKRSSAGAAEIALNQRREPWRKIIIIVEGIYSMEGTIVNLPEVIRLKRRYRAYLYMDEAHSIGAMGARGRGICDYYGCDPRDVDILMGTFTKSFAAAGGYIAGSRAIIDYIRSSSPSYQYCPTMAPPVVRKISFILDQFLAMDRNNNHHDHDNQNYNHHNNHDEQSVDNFISGAPSKAPCDVQQRIAKLRKNTMYFRQKLKSLGFHLDGDIDSPVVPIMVYSPALLKCLISELLAKGIASTGAAFPVTSLIGIRARFCLSAAHTDQMIEYTIACLDEIGQKIGIKFDQNPRTDRSASSVSSTAAASAAATVDLTTPSKK